MNSVAIKTLRSDLKWWQTDTSHFSSSEFLVVWLVQFTCETVNIFCFSVQLYRRLFSFFFYISMYVLRLFHWVTNLVLNVYFEFLVSFSVHWSNCFRLLGECFISTYLLEFISSFLYLYIILYIKHKHQSCSWSVIRVLLSNEFCVLLY